MILLLSSLILWFCLFLWINGGLPKLPSSEGLTEEQPDLTVLIAMRDERRTVRRLLESINNQQNLKTPIKVVLTDDGSVDDSAELAMAVADELPNLSLEVLYSDQQGKKAALSKGLSKVDSEWMYLTDADCELSPTTISRMVECGVKSSASAVFGPVLLMGNGLWAKMQGHEHLNNQVVSQALFKRGTPVLINGANMLIHSSSIAAYEKSLKSNRVSGDDVLYARSLEPSEIAMCLSPASAVYTDSAPSWNAFWNQRLRWLSKQNDQGSSSFSFSAAVFALSVLHITTVIYLFAQAWWYWLILYLIVRLVIEGSFHSPWFRRLHEAYHLGVAALISLVYPLYVVTLGIASLFKPSFRWKGRTYNA